MAQGMLSGDAMKEIKVGDMTCTLKADGEYECVDAEGNKVAVPAYSAELGGEMPSLEGIEM